MAPLVENRVEKITWNRDRLPTTVGFPDRSVDKESTCSAGTPVQFLGWEDPLEKG